MENGGEAGRRRFYGRRKGHRLSARRQHLIETLLPRVAIDLAKPAPETLTTLFDPPVRSVWLEVGFGAGEHLIWQAERNRDVGLIGCEPFINGIAKVLSEIDERELGTVRLHADDARDVLAWLPQSTIDRAFVLFPDPWPKKRHKRRRLISGETLDALARVLAPGAELRMASDIADYAAVMLGSVLKHPAFSWTATRPAHWRERPDDWPQTRYEEKARAQGRRPYFLTFRRL
jgi:tRNA (guanine-N7-)-methyltransferase